MLREIDACAAGNRWRGHPEACALYCAGLLACSLCLPAWPGALVCATAAALTALIGVGVPAALYLRALVPGLCFVLVGAIVMSMSLCWHDGLALTWDGVSAARAEEVSLRAFASLSVTVLFSCTVSVPRWLALLRRLRVPGAMLDLFLVCYRTVFLLDEARVSLLRAQNGRLGYASARAARRSSAMAAAGLFLRALAQAQRLERGLQARNYDGRLEVLPAPSRTKPIHLATAVAVPAALAALVHCIR